MIRISVLAFVAFVVAACSAANPSPTTVKGEECSLREGQACVRDTQCCSLWCVNHECVRRES
jgi:hypothetical protein